MMWWEKDDYDLTSDDIAMMINKGITVSMATMLQTTWPSSTTARIEDLEESLRRIVTVIGHDPQHTCCDRDDAVLAIAHEALNLDPPISTRAGRERQQDTNTQNAKDTT